MMKRTMRTMLGLALAVSGLLILSLLSLSVQAQLRLPPVPQRGTPRGNQSPGTRRPENPCPAIAQPLSAINANNGSDFTAEASPTFVFYVPYRAEAVDSLEFLLLDGQERRTLYRTEVTPAAAPGLVTVSIPEDTVLMTDSLYRWYLKLDCTGSEAESPYVVVDGWVQRIAPGEETAWYDEVSDRALTLIAAPQDPQAQADWQTLLDTLGLNNLSPAYKE